MGSMEHPHMPHPSARLSLVGFLDAYEVYRDPVCLDAFECLWDFVNKHMIVWFG